MRLFVQDFAASRFLSRLLRLLRLFKIYWDISKLLRLLEGLQAQKSWQIEKSWSRKMIKSTNSWLRSRQTVKIYQKIQVWTDFSILIKTLGLKGGVETKWRFLNRQEKLFKTVKTFSTVSTVETYFLPVSRLRVSIETRLRQIETPQAYYKFNLFQQNAISFETFPQLLRNSITKCSK